MRIAAEFRVTRDVVARIREREISGRSPGPLTARAERGATRRVDRAELLNGVGRYGPGGLPQGDRRVRSAAKDLDPGRASRSGVRRMLPGDIRRAVVKIR